MPQSRLVQAARVLLRLNVLLLPLPWVLVYAGLAPVRDQVPGYAHWSLAFVPADAWLWLISVAALIRWKQGGIDAARALVCAVGAILIFILIYVSVYEARNGLFMAGLVDPATLGQKLYTVATGAVLFMVGSIPARR